LHREKASSGPDKVKMTLAEEVVFLNKGRIKKELNELPSGAQVTIDMSKSFVVDYDVLEIIHDFKDQAKHRNISVTVIRDKTSGRQNGKDHQKTVYETEIEQRPITHSITRPCWPEIRAAGLTSAMLLILMIYRNLIIPLWYPSPSIDCLKPPKRK
jgi:MFS superfamily sulfate permease-like transporter